MNKILIGLISFLVIAVVIIIILDNISMKDIFNNKITIHHDFEDINIVNKKIKKVYIVKEYLHWLIQIKTNNISHWELVFETFDNELLLITTDHFMNMEILKANKENDEYYYMFHDRKIMLDILWVKNVEINITSLEYCSKMIELFYKLPNYDLLSNNCQQQTIFGVKYILYLYDDEYLPKCYTGLNLLKHGLKDIIS